MNDAQGRMIKSRTSHYAEAKKPSQTPNLDENVGLSTGTEVGATGLFRADPFIRLLSGRWTLRLLDHLASGGCRYQDLHTALSGISYKVLTDTLRRAERDGLIRRRLDGARIETATLYELTDLGRSLEIPIDAALRWMDDSWKAIEAARHQWDQLQ